MPEQVRVEDFEVFRLFRVALLKFAQAAGQSLANGDGEIGRIHSWLEGEQTAYWQSQLRKRTDAFGRARDALRLKKLFKDASGKTPNAAVEEKEFARCRAAMEEAQRKIELVRRAIPKLEKEAELYRGAVSRLGGTVSVEIPRAVALLDRLAGTLEEYVQIEGPAISVPEGIGATAEDSMSRGGDAGAEPPPKAAAPPAATNAAAPAAAPAGSPEPPPEKKERRDVADGK